MNIKKIVSGANRRLELFANQTLLLPELLCDEVAILNCGNTNKSSFNSSFISNACPRLEINFASRFDVPASFALILYVDLMNPRVLPD